MLHAPFLEYDFNFHHPPLGQDTHSNCIHIAMIIKIITHILFFATYLANFSGLETAPNCAISITRFSEKSGTKNSIRRLNWVQFESNLYLIRQPISWRFDFRSVF